MALVSTAFCLVYFLSKKEHIESTFFTNLKIVMKLENEDQDAYDETFYMIFFFT
jgi:hypothetical protein